MCSSVDHFCLRFVVSYVQSLETIMYIFSPHYVICTSSIWSLEKERLHLHTNDRFGLHIQMTVGISVSVETCYVAVSKCKFVCICKFVCLHSCVNANVCLHMYLSVLFLQSQ